MRASRRALLAVLLAIGIPAVAAAFTLLRVDGNPCGTRQNLYWASAGAPISVDALSGARANLVLQALGSWNDSVARFRFRSSSGGRCDTNDGIIGVGVAATSCDGRSLEGVLALTTSIFRTDNGQLVDGSVTFNVNAAPLDDQAIFLQAALHELGHVLGLDHSDACGGSGAGTLMKTSIVLSDPRLSAPQGDDINGANAIYGGGVPTPTPTGRGDPTPLPEGTNSCAAGGGGGVTLPMLALLGLLVLRRARRRPEVA